MFAQLVNENQDLPWRANAYTQIDMESLENQLFDCELHTTDELGIPPDAVEAVAFAWLAKRRMENKYGNLTSVTGADDQVILGAIYNASPGN